MLHLVRSPLPGTRYRPPDVPVEVGAFLQRLTHHPERCHWVFPTGRLRRAALREWPVRARSVSQDSVELLAYAPGSDGAIATLLPNLHTLESFVAWALEYCEGQRPSVTATERLLRLARAWREITGRPAGPGLLGQLDRFVRDWQACALPPPKKPADDFERLIARYLADLKKDERLDRMSSVAALTEELQDPDSWLNRTLLSAYLLWGEGLGGRGGASAHANPSPPAPLPKGERGERASSVVLFDGFHCLEEVELQLIAALAQRCDVLLWLVGTPGSRAWQTVERISASLRQNAGEVRVHDVLASRGHQLSEHPGQANSRGSPPLLAKLEVRTVVDELEAVSARIKADFRSAEKSDRPLRLSDVAVIIPGPHYDPLVREVFPRYGLEFNLAGQAMSVAASRPARLLFAALDILHGQWRHDLVLDFVQHPLVLKHLRQPQRLHDLFTERPRARQRLDFAVWCEAWDRLIVGERKHLELQRSGTLPLPEHRADRAEEYLARRHEDLGGLEALIASLKVVLQPIARMDDLLLIKTSKKPLRQLATLCAELLRLLEIEQWLAPRLRENEEPAFPWVEFEKDQQAYAQLLALLEAASELPDTLVPQDESGRPDALSALRLALESATYQIKTEDDAGVQLFELRESRGLRFRHMYVLGLVDGQVPELPEEGMLATRRRQVEPLRRQLEEKECEAEEQFAQVFAAAEELLVLARTTHDGEETKRPSPFWRSVAERVELPDLATSEASCTVATAARVLGARARGLTATSRGSRSPLTPNPSPPVGRGGQGVQRLQNRLDAWRSRSHWPTGIRVDLPALLRSVFPDDRPFSASDLESYASCPFRYFGQRVLGLAEREDEPGRMLYGSLIHRIFERLYAHLREQQSLATHEPLPALDGQALDKLLELFGREWDQHDEGLLPVELQGLFRPPAGVLGLVRDALRLLEEGHGNLLNEFVLGSGPGRGLHVGADADGRPVFLSGKIDRVDVDRQAPHQAIVTDYKTGQPMPRKALVARMGDGRLLQLPLYGALLQTVRSDLEVVGGLYLHVTERAHSQPFGAKDVLCSFGAAPGAKDEVPFSPADALRLALEFVQRIRTGQFPLSPHANSETSECTSYCALRHACRQPAGYSTK